MQYILSVALPVVLGVILLVVVFSLLVWRVPALRRVFLPVVQYRRSRRLNRGGKGSSERSAGEKSSVEATIEPATETPAENAV